MPKALKQYIAYKCRRIILVLSNATLVILEQTIGKLVPCVAVIGSQRLAWIPLSLTRLRLWGLAKGIRISVVDIDCGIDALTADGITQKTSAASSGLLHASIKYPFCVESECSQFDIEAQRRLSPQRYDAWLHLAQGVLGRVRLALLKIKPVGILYLQGYFVDTYIAREVAMRDNLKCIALECTAYSRKIIAETESGIAVNRTSAGECFRRHKNLVPEKVVADWFVKFREIYFEAKKPEHCSGVSRLPRHGKPRVFFIGQCYTDSSLLFDEESVGWGDTAAIIDRLLSLCDQKGWELVVKLHPKEHGGFNPLLRPYNDLTYRVLLSRRPQIDKDFAAGGHTLDRENVFDTRDLITSADVVVTINSQGGLEALMLGRPVVLCGHAFYSSLISVLTVTQPIDMGGVLSDLISNGRSVVSEKEIKCFLYIYYEIFCVEKNPRALAKRMAECFHSH